MTVLICKVISLTALIRLAHKGFTVFTVPNLSSSLGCAFHSFHEHSFSHMPNVYLHHILSYNSYPASVLAFNKNLISFFNLKFREVWTLVLRLRTSCKIHLDLFYWMLQMLLAFIVLKWLTWVSNGRLLIECVCLQLVTISLYVVFFHFHVPVFVNF